MSHNLISGTPPIQLVSRDSKALSTLLSFCLKTKISLCFGFLSILKQCFCQAKRNFSKIISIWEYRFRVVVWSVKTEAFDKQCSMLKTMALVYSHDAYFNDTYNVYIGNVHVMCYSLSHCCYSFVTLFTLNITGLQRWQKSYSAIAILWQNMRAVAF